MYKIKNIELETQDIQDRLQIMQNKMDEIDQESTLYKHQEHDIIYLFEPVELELFFKNLEKLDQSKSENYKLRNRCSELEEFLREAESERDYHQRFIQYYSYGIHMYLSSKTSSQHCEDFVKLEREKKHCEELLQQQVQQLESENSNYISENEKLRQKVDKVILPSSRLELTIVIGGEAG